MTRRVFLLMGLAILAVVWSHAAGFGQMAMFLWTDRYRPVSAPNFDQLGTLPYYVLLVIRQVTVWAVPAFLFISGFFVAYTGRGSQSTWTWKAVAVRIRNLLIPYLIWSAVFFIENALEGVTYAPTKYLAQLATGMAGGGYFYVPLLCQVYLLSPLLLPIAKSGGRALLLAAALLQVVTLGILYLPILGLEVPARDLFVTGTYGWLFLWWAFFFPFGMVCGLNVKQVQGWLSRYKWVILFGTIVLAVLSIVEPEVIYRVTGRDWRSVPLTITTSLYSVAFVLSFLAFDKVSVPFSKTVWQIGTKSYGIYLLHMLVMQFVARVIRQFTPWMLAKQVLLFMPVMLGFGLGIPLLLMAVVNKLPVRTAYRYLFG